ncbi:membrane protein [Corynebacterium phocae]|uniref:Membrane protein n=1 Tax=Corynebacterium phocae TaxID=161895 RepID=A0A1L7D2B0_9CORY|nr:membrane protein [Corynebacterium phocae]
MFLGVWVLFLLAGLLVGGAWAGYQNEQKGLTVMAAILATVTFAAAIAWMISEMGS